MRAIVIVLVAFLFLVGGCNVISTQGDSCAWLDSAAKDECYTKQLACSKIKDQENRDSCVVGLAKEKGELAVCDLIKTANIKAYCQHELAVQQNDHEICISTIENTYWRDNCHFNLALANNQQQYCTFIDHSKQQQDCYYKIAVATSDPELCKRLAFEDKEQCFTTVAIALPDAAVCDEINTPISRNTCVYKVAKKTNDSSLCQTITFSSIRRLCREQVIST